MNSFFPLPEEDDSVIIVLCKIALAVLTIAVLIFSAFERTSTVIKRKRNRMGFRPSNER